MRLGILGGGQLARMLALAGYPLGFRFLFLDPAPDACAFPLGEALHGAYDDLDLLAQLANESDKLTFEFENISAAALRSLSGIALDPPLEALSIKKDRNSEKRLFQELEIPTTPFRTVDSPEDLAEAVRAFGRPVVLKTRSQGYDGKGQRIVRDADGDTRALRELGGSRLIAERFIPFEREISVIAVRGSDGTRAFYPISENTHENGILVSAESRPDDRTTERACELTGRLLDRLQYVGTLALEFFEHEGELLANEFAPRVHNSGHWTIEGAETSQFENHLRAIAGMPLGSTAALGAVAMRNCIGTMPAPAPLLSIEGVHAHDYGKAPRPGRKLGHITVRAESRAELAARLAKLDARLASVRFSG
ncbi:MAG: 5-(carboxyamino)imidazole ribonucleotide synthase [Gemmatimonadetes bacterium]|nr:5-(carboxyamino)imidazole ribonucleotide synthase [Gemmatimonadota bacterium]